jgi:hypothetical protein
MNKKGELFLHCPIYGYDKSLISNIIDKLDISMSVDSSIEFNCNCGFKIEFKLQDVTLRDKRDELLDSLINI